MTYWLSEPIEELLSKNQKQDDYDLLVKTLIIGSGYGAAMAALAIAEKQKKLNIDDSIWVFERGNEYVPDDFPKTIADVPSYFNITGGNSEEKNDNKDNKDGTEEDLEWQQRLQWQKRLNQQQLMDKALWDIRVGEGVTTVAGNGLGGTSLVNANVAMQPDPDIFQNWPKLKGPSWEDRLKPNYSKIKELLGAKTMKNARSFSKYQALGQTAQALGAVVEPAELTINFEKPTKHSADHEPCNNCGNCVVGCHSGAKGSLNMNAWPLARQLGVELFTGATISSLEQKDNGWLIHCFNTRDKNKPFTVLVERVILSAGTIGSTEILMRSETTEEDEDKNFSSQLGKRFSTNGDALVFGLGQANKVNSLADLPQDTPATNTSPGPTIIGKARVDLTTISDEHNTSANKFTLEDGAIPYALKTLWKELITTQTFIKKFVSSRETSWHIQNSFEDPLASYESFADHSQVLLAMGIDNSELGELISDETNGKVIPKWTKPKSGEENFSNDYFENLHSAFQRAEEKGGFNDGHYMPNPAWKTLPDGFGDVIEGGDLFDEHLISVHPLGGCGMGDNSENGVVNHKGQVFSGESGTETYDGLYVLDGAILPGAIGVNPFLTIAALSYTLALDIIPDEVGKMDRSFPYLTDKRFKKIPSGAIHKPLTTDDKKISAVFEEELNCIFLNKEETNNPQGLSSITVSEINRILNLNTDNAIPNEARKFILSIKIFFGENEDGFGDKQQTITDWLERPSMKLSAEATLNYDNSESVHSTPSSYHEKIGTIKGTVCLGAYNKPRSCLELIIRIVKALCKYIKFRPHDLKIALKNLNNSNSKGGGIFKRIIGFLRVAKMHATYRYLEYEFGDTLVLNDQKIEGINLSGKKKLAYSTDSRDVWDALVTLPVTLRNSKVGSLKFDMAVDLIKMLKQPAPIQITSSPNGVSSLMAVLSMGGYFLRSVLQTHFWSFGAPSYEHFMSKADQENPKIPIDSKDRRDTGNTQEIEGKKDNPESRMVEPPKTIKYGINLISQEKEKFYRDEDTGLVKTLKDDAIGGKDYWTRIIRYQPEDDTETANPENRKSLLLVHGLAHSSRIFWTDTIEVNSVQYFLSKNYDVWIVDHRASPNTIKEVNPVQTWDDIAQIDIPWAVKAVFDTINENNEVEKKKVHIFSHCIGAGAVAMATLTAKLNYQKNGKDDSMIASLATHAVTPWLYASRANLARSHVWDYFNDLDLIKTVEPMPHPDTKGIEMIFDRIASAQIDDQERQWWKSWLIPNQDFDDIKGIGFPSTIYSRYSIFWGKQFNHENINEETRFKFARMVGETPIEMLQQVFYSIIQGRLLDHKGRNIYVNEKKFQDNWIFPTLFLHGNKNTVFDINSSKLSADKLTRYKDSANSKTSIKDANEKLTAKDYSENNVWVEFFDNYGHLDVIFGKNANRDVYPKIHHFFQAADKEGEDTLTHAYEDIVNKPGQAVEFIPGSSRIPSLRTSELPLTGPIISRPTKGNGNTKNNIRLWVEAWDIVDQVPSEFSIECESKNIDKVICKDPIHSDTDKISSGSTSNRPREDFCILNYEFPEFPHERQYFLIQNWEKHSKEIPLDWHKMPWFRRVFGPRDDSEEYSLSFLVGSCFHPGTTFDREISSKAFRKMYKHVKEGVDHLLLLGDQIYADANANIFDPNMPFEKYRLRYRQAFANEDARKLFSNVPVYFAVDDHELNNNWQGKFNSSVTDKNYNYAKGLARLYQMHDDNSWNQDQGLWYDFETRGYPFFVMDTRFERQNGKEIDRSDLNALMTDNQIEGFDMWLRDNKDSDVLFIASGSTIGPFSKDIVKANSLANNSDRLMGYPGFLEKIIDLLSDLASDKTIIWLSGDPHFSSLTKCSFHHNNKTVNMYQICSSGIYCPFPFANDNANNYVWSNDFDWSNDNDENWGNATTQSIQLKVSEDDYISIEFVQKLLSADLSNFVRIDLKHKNNVDIRQNTIHNLSVTLDIDGNPILSIEC